MTDLLRKVPFTADLLDIVQVFDCGSDEWAVPLNHWIKAGPHVNNGAIAQMSAAAEQGKRLDVWLHANEAGELVGYSSLGETNWRWPNPKDPRVPLSIIPCLAIDKRFHRKPDTPPRYSKQIMDHLVDEAQQQAARRPLIGLCVDPRNTAAIRYYLREGFQNFSQYVDPEDGITYQRMLVKIEEYQAFAVAPAI
jgi:ribosomal protein S18 acetylase RimI-like enzyme